MKATWVEVNGEGRSIYKTPKTDSGLKNSARGRLAVTKGLDGSLALVENASSEQESVSLLRPVWRDGKPLVHQSFDEVRARAREALR